VPPCPRRASPRRLGFPLFRTLDLPRVSLSDQEFPGSPPWVGFYHRMKNPAGIFFCLPELEELFPFSTLFFLKIGFPFNFLANGTIPAHRSGQQFYFSLFFLSCLVKFVGCTARLRRFSFSDASFNPFHPCLRLLFLLPLCNG